MTQMLAGRLNVKTREFEVREVPVPEPAYGEVRIEVEAAGVCLSDVHLIDGTLSPLYLATDEVTLGHEVAGTIDVVGKGVQGLTAGQRVLLQAGELSFDQRILTRGVDYDGGWAEYAVARWDTVVPIPDSMPFEHACIVPDAVSTPWAAVATTGAVQAGEAVGIWGLGGLGSHAVQLARLVGAAPIIAIDPSEAARDRALGFGADLALDPGAADFKDTVMDATDGTGLNVALDFAGVPAVREQAFRVLGPRGRLVIVGLANQPIGLPHDTLFAYLQQQVLGSYGSEPQHVVQLVNLVKRGRLDLSGSISAVLPLSEAAEAVRRLETKEGDPIRIVLKP